MEKEAKGFEGVGYSFEGKGELFLYGLFLVIFLCLLKSVIISLRF